MIKIFTPDDVIRLVYDEVTDEEAAEINQAMVCDNELQEAYKSIRHIKDQLTRAVKQPSENVINRILNYSKSVNLPSKK